MDRENLVVLKGDKELILGSETLYPNKYYRCLKATEMDADSYFVDGNNMTHSFFEKYFEFAYDRIMRDWETIGLTKGGKLVNKTTFRELANVHTYGKQSNNLRIIFFGLPKDCMYGFYPIYNENKAKQLNAMYSWCEQVIGGYMGYFDQDCIQFGKYGIPINYGDLRTR